MRRYLLTAEAKPDLAEIKRYLMREAGPRVAKSTLLKIKAALVLLGSTPGAGQIREDLTSEPLKFWPVFSYPIAYNPAKHPIHIMRVIHGNREVSAILGQDDD